MFWIIFTGISAFFGCIGNYIQNFLTDTALPRRRAGSYIITRILSYSLAIILLLAIFGRAVFMLPLQNALGIMLAGAINIVGSIYHFKSLQAGDTFDVTIYNYAGPIISLGLGAVILGESINTSQGFGFIFIMVAALVVVLDKSNKKASLNPNFSVALIAIIHSFFSVLSDIVYARFLGEGTPNYFLFAQSFFFFEVGSLLTAIVILIFFPSWRKAFVRTFLRGNKRITYLFTAFVDNILFLLGEIFYKLALLAAPIVALVALVSKVTGLFVSFLLTTIVGRTFPKFIRSRRLTKQLLLRYLSAGILVVVGIMMMN